MLMNLSQRLRKFWLNVFVIKEKMVSLTKFEKEKLKENLCYQEKEVLVF